MAKENLLKISYKRVVSTEEVVLTLENCESYGYTATSIEIDGQTWIAFINKETNETIRPNIENGVATTKVLYEKKKEYTHIAPPCSKYNISYADVDKEGSGRNSLTGEMFRERIGNYCMLEVAWDLIPNTKEYNNWYKILTSLPPYVNLHLLKPNGNIEIKKMYRGDISTNLYLFVENAQIWQGLSTTFTQWDVDPYDDTVELTVQYTIRNKETEQEIVVYDFEWEDDYSKTNEWEIVE